MATEKRLVPQDEKPRFVCDGCGGRLLSGAVVRQEVLYGDVVGCGDCSEWVMTAELAVLPEACPNCGQWLAEATRVVVTSSGVVMACDECACDRFAVDVCRPGEEEGAFIHI